ncbi:PKD domain-containing protein, partial [Granulosicoccus sp.]
MAQADTLYEDAEDGLINGWSITDNTPAGASVTNVFDSDLGSNVIRLDGTGSNTANAFLLGGLNDSAAWRNDSEFTLSFRLRSSQPYVINIRLSTTEGVRYVRYKNTNATGNLVGNTVDIGLGTNTTDDTWYQFTRDLQQDLSAGEPGTIITEVDGFWVRGHLHLDDISLNDPNSTPTTNIAPVANAGAAITVTVGDAQTLDASLSDDADGTIDSYQWRIAGTTAVIATGVSPTLSPALAQGLYSLELTVTDNQNATDTDTVSLTVNATNTGGGGGNSSGGTLYEDAEDGLTTGWSITDNSPAGATVTNVFDATLGSNVISLDGTGSSTANAFLLGGLTGSEAWGNETETTLSFKLRSDEPYIINIRLSTDLGVRYIRYRNNSANGNLVGNSIDFGLGTNTVDGNWHQFTRDLQQELSAGEPGNTITQVNGFWVRGHLQLDDISLSDPNSTPTTNIAPVANAGTAITVTVGDAQTLDASLSDDADGTIDSYQWRIAGTTTVIATGVSPTLSPALTQGLYSLELTVTDNQNATD